jgi:hypothetical protein
VQMAHILRGVEPTARARCFRNAHKIWRVVRAAGRSCRFRGQFGQQGTTGFGLLALVITRRMASINELDGAVALALMQCAHHLLCGLPAIPCREGSRGPQRHQMLPATAAIARWHARARGKKPSRSYSRTVCVLIPTARAISMGRSACCSSSTVVFHLLWVVWLGPRQARVELSDTELQVHLGWAFESVIPRRAIVQARRRGAIWYAVGVHTTFRGRWIVNGSPHGMVELDLVPRVPARTLGMPIHPWRLDLSFVDPEAFLRALGTSPST